MTDKAKAKLKGKIVIDYFTDAIIDQFVESTNWYGNKNIEKWEGDVDREKILAIFQ